MCGIAGIYCYAKKRKVQNQILEKLGDSMQARGPDGAGRWLSNDHFVGLAHRRLSIVDLSNNAAQPMKSCNGELQIVFNGEIYNYRFLRDQLIRQGVTFESSSDTEVILKLYERDGLRSLSQLRGMFAFGIWDNRKRRLLLARDPFGIKPLYYSDNGADFAFASQVRTLRDAGWHDCEIDPAGVIGFCLWGHVPDPFTPYKQIKSLPAGAIMQVSPQGIERLEYYSQPLSALQDPQPIPKNVDYLRECLAESVAQHMVADVPVGAFLSAGIDSSVICALASRQPLAAPLRTVTLGFREYAGTVNDEVPLAKESAAMLQTDHVVKQISQADFDVSREKFLTDMDQPSIDGLNTWFVSRVASECGLKVALSGLGGDELFGGYPSFQQVPFLARCFGWIPDIVSDLATNLLDPISRIVRRPKVAGLMTHGRSLAGSYFLRRSLFLPEELNSFFSS
ncbi:MAG: asparagine synthase (glutamine-hydrolyzing), partial [Bdellovibrionales bacterium]|nr:asparagine synthase (glutamine-hydrolyzing) [Bdellovibrionales bacterium]